VQKSGSKTRGRTRTGAIAVVRHRSAPPSARTDWATPLIASAAASRARVSNVVATRRLGSSAITRWRRPMPWPKDTAPAWARNAGRNWPLSSQSSSGSSGEAPSFFQTGPEAATVLPATTTSLVEAAVQASRRDANCAASTVDRSVTTSRATGSPVNDQTNFRSLPSRPGSTKSGIRSPGRRESVFVIILSVGCRSCRDCVRADLREDDQDTGSPGPVASQVAALCG